MGLLGCKPKDLFWRDSDKDGPNSLAWDYVIYLGDGRRRCLTSGQMTSLWVRDDIDKVIACIEVIYNISKDEHTVVVIVLFSHYQISTAIVKTVALANE